MGEIGKREYRTRLDEMRNEPAEALVANGIVVMKVAPPGLVRLACDLMIKGRRSPGPDEAMVFRGGERKAVLKRPEKRG